MITENNTDSNLKVIEENQPEENYLRLDEEQRNAINRALLIGLASYAEIERLANAYRIEEMLSKGEDEAALLERLQPFHPTGSSETLGELVDALRYIN